MATSIAAAVEQQSASAREIASSMQTAAQNTVHTADEIKAVEQVARRGADAAGEIQGWTERLSARAVALESKVGDFFERVRTEQPRATPGSAAAAALSRKPAFPRLFLILRAILPQPDALTAVAGWHLMPTISCLHAAIAHY